MTFLRHHGLFMLSAAMLLPGCPGGGGGDAGPDIITRCADLAGITFIPGAPCSFTEVCPDHCGDIVTCVDGGLMRTMTKPCLDGGVGDAGTLDASVDASGDVGLSDAGGADDAGMCAPEETASSCRSDADCRGVFEQCLAPGEFGGCGICMEPIALCESDADCSASDICFTYRPLCSCGGDASECRARCTEGSCDAGESCDASSGRCRPTTCSEGYVCPAHTICMPSSGAADPHGCERKACTTDAQCDCGGGCVDGFCYEALGTCSAIPA